MKTEGFFTIHKYEIIVNQWKQGKPIKLIPIGDVHFMSHLYHEEKFNMFCDWAKKQRDIYYILMGDMIDYMSTSERNHLRISDYHESTVMDMENIADHQVNEFCEKTKFMKGKLIGAIGGNHYFSYQSGMTSTDKICEYFKCKNLGVASFVRLILKDKNIGKKKSPHSAKIDIYAHHGLGGGRTSGASVNKLENATKGKIADIYLMGHDHKKLAVPSSRLALTDSKKTLKLVQKKIFMIRTGGFIRGFVNGKKSYIAEGDFNPTDLGVVKILLLPKRDKNRTRYIDIHASV